MIKRNRHVTSKGFFRYSEFYKSAEYPRLVEDIPFDQSIIESIFFWVDSAGDKFRQSHPKVRLCILSGVRSKELNERISGSLYSDHLSNHYSAVDIYSPDINASSLFCQIIDQGLPHRQLIWCPDKKFIHWSWNIPGKPFKQEVKII